MSVTIKNIASQFNTTRDTVKQIGSKQLFIVSTPTGTVLVSYYTIVGKLVAGTWYLTTKKYSVTTSKQLRQFASGRQVQHVDNLDNLDNIPC